MSELEWNRKFGAKRGHSEDITSETLTIYELDGMEFNIEILFGKKTGNSRHCGKPVVMLAVCQRSRAVVGWYVSMGKENGLAYKHLLFSAFTSKDSRLEKWNAQNLNGFVFGFCHKMVIDRGPGISVSPTVAFSEQLRVDMVLTKPRHGEGKGVVERVNGLFQERLSELKGGFKRTKSLADQDKHANSTKETVITYEVFNKLLLHAISDHNLYCDVRELITAEMSDAGVFPNPKAVFLFNLNQQRGDSSHAWAEAYVYKLLLNKKQLSAPLGVVSIGRAQYRSDALSKFYEDWATSPHPEGDSPKINILILQETVEQILWERDDGSISPLVLMKRSSRQFSGMDQFKRGLAVKNNNNNFRKQNLERTRNAVLSKSKMDVMLNAERERDPKPTLGDKKRNRLQANEVLKIERARLECEILQLPPPEQPFSDNYLHFQPFKQVDVVNLFDVPVETDW